MPNEHTGTLTPLQDTLYNPVTWRYDDNYAHKVLRRSDKSYDAESDPNNPDTPTQKQLSLIQAMRPQLDPKSPNYAIPDNMAKPYYERFVKGFAQAYGIPEEELLANIDTESMWRKGAESDTGARGMAQTFQAAEKDASKALGRTPDDHPVNKLEAGLMYYKLQREKYGNVKDAVYAYKEGPTWFDRWNEQGRPPQDPKAQRAEEHWNKYVKYLQTREAGGSPVPGTSRVEYASQTPPVSPKDASGQKQSLVTTAGRAIAGGTLDLIGSVATLGRMVATSGSDTEKNLDALRKAIEIDKQNYREPEEITGKNIWDNPELLLSATFLTDTVFRALPSSLATMGATGVVGKGGQLVYKTIMEKLGKKAAPEVMRRIMMIGAGVGGGVGGGLEMASTYEELLKNGASENQARVGAIGMGLASTGLNAISNWKIFDKSLRSRILNFLQKGAIEGITEYLEEPAEIIMKILAANVKGGYKGPTKDEIISQLKNGFNVIPAAGITGGAISTVAGWREVSAMKKQKADMDATAKGISETLGGEKQRIEGKEVPEPEPGAASATKPPGGPFVSEEITEEEGRRGKQRLSGQSVEDPSTLPDGTLVLTKGQGTAGIAQIKKVKLPDGTEETRLYYPGGRTDGVKIRPGAKIATITSYYQDQKEEGAEPVKYTNDEASRIANERWDRYVKRSEESKLDPDERQEVPTAIGYINLTNREPLGSSGSGIGTDRVHASIASKFVNWLKRKGMDPEANISQKTLDMLAKNAEKPGSYPDISHLDPAEFEGWNNVTPANIQEFLKDMYAGVDENGEVGWTVTRETAEKSINHIIGAIHTLASTPIRKTKSYLIKPDFFLGKFLTSPESRAQAVRQMIKALENSLVAGKSVPFSKKVSGYYPITLEGMVGAINNATKEVLDAKESGDALRIEEALRDRALLLLMYNTGARQGDVIGWKYNDIRTTLPTGGGLRPNINWFQGKTEEKAGTETTIPLLQETIGAIQEYNQARINRGMVVTEKTPLFSKLVKNVDSQLTATDINDKIIRENLPPEHLKDANPNPRKGKRRDNSSHNIRNSFTMHTVANSNGLIGPKDMQSVGGWAGGIVDTSYAKGGDPVKWKNDILTRFHPISVNTDLQRLYSEAQVSKEKPASPPFEQGGPSTGGTADEEELRAGHYTDYKEPVPGTADEKLHAAKGNKFPKGSQPGKVPGAPGEIFSRWGILDFIRNRMGQMMFIRAKSKMGRALGKFNNWTELIALRSDFEVVRATHETAHAIYRYLFPGGVSRTGQTRVAALSEFEDIIPEFIPADVREKYPPDKWMAEGHSWFMTHYLTRSYETKQDGSPDFSKPIMPGDSTSPDPIARRKREFAMWYDQMLHNTDPELYETLQVVTQAFYLYQSQSAYYKGLSEMVFGGKRDDDQYKTVNELFTRYMSRFNFLMIDAVKSLEDIVNTVQSEGGVVKPSDNPYYSARLYRGGMAVVQTWLGSANLSAMPWLSKEERFGRPTNPDGVPYIIDGQMVKSLREIIEQIPKPEQMEWRYTLALLSAWERHQKNPEYQTQFTKEAVDEAQAKYAANPHWQEAAKDFRRWMKATIRYLADTGLLTYEADKGVESKYELITEMYEMYAPIERDISKKTGIDFYYTKLSKTGTGPTAEVRATLVPRQSEEGSTLPIIDPIETATRRIIMYVMAAHKQRVLFNLVKMLYGIERNKPQPKRLGDEKMVGIWQNASRWLIEVERDVEGFEVGRAQFASKVLPHMKEETRTTVRTEAKELEKKIRTIIDGAGGVAEIKTKGGQMIKDQIIEALENRGRSKAEAEAFVNMLVRHAQMPEYSDEKIEKIITREIEKTTEITIFLETVKELIFTPPERTVFFRPKSGKPVGDAGSQFVFQIIIDGQKRFFQITDPALMDTFRQGLSLASGDWDFISKSFMNAMRFPARMLRMGATLDPSFILRNAIRDQFSATIYNKYGYVPVIDLFKGLGNVLGMTEKQRAQNMQHILSGSANVGLFTLDTERVVSMQKEIVKNAPPNIAKNVIFAPASILRKTYELLGGISEGIEKGTRIAVFNRAMRNLVKAGYSVKDARILAGMDSMEATLDFRRAGIHSRQLNLLCAFYNAGIQGMDKMRREFFSIRPQPYAVPLGPMQKVMTKVLGSDLTRLATVWMRAFMYITLPSILNGFLQYDDPGYDELAWYWKDLFWCFRTPWNPNHGSFRSALKKFVADYNVKHGKGYTDFSQIPDRELKKEFLAKADEIWPMLRLPKPFEPGILFGSVFERATVFYLKNQDGTAEGGNTLGDRLSRYMLEGLSTTLGNVFSPIPMPNALGVPLEAAYNFSGFTGRYIIPMGMESLPGKDQYSHYTTESGKLIARSFGNIPFRNVWEKGFKLTSPMIVEHYVRNIFGGLGTAQLKFGDYLLKNVYQKEYLKSMMGEGETWDRLSESRKMKLANDFAYKNRLGIHYMPEKETYWADVPFINAFVVRYPSANTENIRRFYDRWKTAQQTWGGLESKLKTQVSPGLARRSFEEFVSENMVHVPLWGSSKELVKATKDFNNVLVSIKEVANDPRLNASQRAQRIDLLYLDLGAAANIANKKYDEFKDWTRTPEGKAKMKSISENLHNYKPEEQPAMERGLGINW